MIFAFGVADSLQPIILLDKDYYNIDKERAGTIMSYILLVQLAVKMLVTILYGFLIDKLGRKTMIYYGALNMLAGFLIVPLSKDVYPGFVLAKILISNGGSALVTIPLMADYTHDESKGKASGINIALTSIGAFLSNIFLKGLLYAKFSLGSCYCISGILVFGLFILNSLGLKGGKYYLRSKQGLDGQTNRAGGTFAKEALEAISIFFKNSYLTIALVLRIVGNADFYIAFTILSLYIKSLFPPGTDDNESNIVLNNVQSFVFIPALLCNVVYGYYIDRTQKIVGTSISTLAIGAVAFLLTSFVTTPYDHKLRISAVLMGVSVPGVYVVSTYLSIKHFPEEKRGMMMGVFNLMGYIGYVIIASGGGFLFDNWRKDAPFVLYAMLLLIALVLVVWIYFKKMRGRKGFIDSEH